MGRVNGGPPSVGLLMTCCRLGAGCFFARVEVMSGGGFTFAKIRLKVMKAGSSGGGKTRWASVHAAAGWMVNRSPVNIIGLLRLHWAHHNQVKSEAKETHVGVAEQIGIQQI